MSMDTTVSKTICTPKNINIPKRNINKTNFKGETQLHIACLKVWIYSYTILLNTLGKFSFNHIFNNSFLKFQDMIVL